MIKYLFILLFCSIGYGQGVVNNPFIVFGGCSDLYDFGDAADFCDDGNSVSGSWVTSSAPNGIISSVAVGSGSDSYSILFENNSGSYERWTITITGLENGETYDLTIMAKADNGSGGASNDDYVTVSSGTASAGKDFYNLFPTTFSEITQEIVLNATSIELKVYADGGATGTTASRLWVSYFKLVKTS